MLWRLDRRVNLRGQSQVPQMGSDALSGRLREMANPPYCFNDDFSSLSTTKEQCELRRTPEHVVGAQGNVSEIRYAEAPSSLNCVTQGVTNDSTSLKFWAVGSALNPVIPGAALTKLPSYRKRR